MVSDRAFIFHIYTGIPWDKSLLLVPSQGQGQISRSQFFLKTWPFAGALAFHKHGLFQNVFKSFQDLPYHLRIYNL